MPTIKLTEALKDEGLISKAKKDPKNFTEIYLKYYQNIFNYFYFFNRLILLSYNCIVSHDTLFVYII